MRLMLLLFFCVATLFAESEYSPQQIRQSLVPFMTLLEKDTESLSANKDKIDLGRLLFYDNRLSPDLTISCNSCHDLKRYGTGGDYYLKIKEDGSSFREPPSLYNIKNLKLFGWTGGEVTLQSKISASITNAHEMNFQQLDDLTQRLKSASNYSLLFKNIFPESPAPVTLEHVASALAEFIKGLYTPAPIDRFLSGDDSALSDKQLQGAAHFVDNNCFACHTGSGFGGQMLMKLGVIKPWPNQNDQGHFDINKNPAYKMHFRVSPLRNVEKTAPYFHDASSRKMMDAIRKMGYYELGKFIPDDEILLIMEFLKSLTGDIPEAYITVPAAP